MDSFLREEISDLRVDVTDAAGLRPAFGRGEMVGPRAGPTQRTKDQKEWYCLRGLLLTREVFEGLSYPFVVEKSERPDFIVEHPSGGLVGIEITEATEEDWQRELTEDDRQRVYDEVGGASEPTADPNTTSDGDILAELLPGEGFAGDQPERDLCALVVRAIDKKTASLNRGTYAVEQCDLLIYVNSRMSLVANDGKAAAKFLEPKMFDPAR